MTTFDWIGADYAQARTYILGESNRGNGNMTDAEYVRHWIEHPNFLEHAVECPSCAFLGPARLPGEKPYPRDRVYDALTTMMLDWGKVTDASRRAGWNHIAFGNFIPVPLAKRDERPTHADWLQAERGFPARLTMLRPRVCLVLDNPSGALLAAASPALGAAGVRIVRLAHPTMRPAPRTPMRKAAWAQCRGL